MSSPITSAPAADDVIFPPTEVERNQAAASASTQRQGSGELKKSEGDTTAAPVTPAVPHPRTVASVANDPVPSEAERDQAAAVGSLERDGSGESSKKDEYDTTTVPPPMSYPTTTARGVDDGVVPPAEVKRHRAVASASTQREGNGESKKAEGDTTAATAAAAAAAVTPAVQHHLAVAPVANDQIPTEVEHDQAAAARSFQREGSGESKRIASANTSVPPRISSPVTAAPVGDTATPAEVEHDQAAVATSTQGEGSGESKKARRVYQLLALVFGILEVYFSVDNALAEDSFTFSDDPVDFVFASSAVMESVGLAVTFVLALCMSHGRLGTSKYFMDPLGCICIVDTREEGEDGPGGGWLEGFGAPLAVLTSGVFQKSEPLMSLGHIAAVYQVLVVVIFGLVFLFQADATGFIVVVVVVPLVFGCCFLGNVCSQNVLTGRLNIINFWGGLPYWALLLPVAVDVAEVGLLVSSGTSWRTVILALSDVVMVCTVLVPFFSVNACVAAIRGFDNCIWLLSRIGVCVVMLPFRLSGRTMVLQREWQDPDHPYTRHASLVEVWRSNAPEQQPASLALPTV